MSIEMRSGCRYVDGKGRKLVLPKNLIHQIQIAVKKKCKTFENNKYILLYIRTCV